MSMATKRTRRIGNQIRQTLSEMVLRNLRDPRIRRAGIVSVTHVEVSPDLRVAKVFLSATHEQPEARKAMVEGFRSAGRYLRGEVGRRLDLRRVPELRFELDDTLNQAWRLEQVLAEVKTAETATPSSGGDGVPITNPTASTAEPPVTGQKPPTDVGPGTGDDLSNR